MLQPVGGEVGVDARVIGDGREIDEEKQSQSQGGEYGSQKETAMFPDQREHVGNIARIVRFSSSRNRPRMGASPKSIPPKETGSHARGAKAMDPGQWRAQRSSCQLQSSCYYFLLVIRTWLASG